ncbi:exonuclease SbcC [Sporomusaceae bacterium BoRhaA]|uniref:AAA family ATPase n=1 Tax=Pelorhabdus rhamnosifermentans TaxID=2772457 RepID=UPI001C05EED5|nr:AAA family ATPase [Pelorhabdus rhamnosifermentans]MBU2701103.1 exonuclease SbcC [Pelorhabdus rhamnosifermentans]
MKIKAIKINNFLGIDEFNYNPGNLNVFEGPKGSGKSSILEGIETAASNNKRRTEIIKHGNDEATLFIETDTGLEIDRRLRNTKADYLKLRQQGEGIKSTEAELRKLISGDIFRPLDFINLDASKQTAIILSMIKMQYSDEEINGWFGQDVLSNINTSKHLLQVLKDIEVAKYKEREEVNREIKLLEGQVKGIESELPPNYDGEEWKVLKVQDYYNKVAEKQKINNYIEDAKRLQVSIEEKTEAIKAAAEGAKSKIKIKFTEQRQDLKDIVELSKGKIEKANNVINSSADKLEIEQNKLTAAMNEEIAAVKAKYANSGKLLVQKINNEITEQKETINIQNQKISAKEQEILSLSGLEKQELKAEDIAAESEIEKEKLRVGKAAEYLKQHEVTDIEPLQAEADKVADMQSYLREWDRMLDIRDGKLFTKKAYADSLTNIIETARNKPAELLKQHKLPIDGISVDENSMIRINGTLLDGLSDGEKLEAAFKIALQRIGELRVMCLDGFEKLNESEQEKIIKLCADNDLQVFINITKDTDSGSYEIKECL